LTITEQHFTANVHSVYLTVLTQSCMGSHAGICLAETSAGR